MSYNVKSIEVFEKQAKRLIKKYASLKKELLYLVQELKEDPKQGIANGKSCFKIRLAISSKSKGKAVAEGLLRILHLRMQLFSFSPFMIKERRKT